MKVNDSLLSQAAASQLGKTQGSEAIPAGGAQKEGTAGQLQEGDHVQLSNLSGRLLDVLTADSADRGARVERLAAEDRAGRYQADAMAVSRGIIDEALQV